MNGQIHEFFLRYDHANSSSDPRLIGAMYADTFMFGGPAGIQVIKKDDFLKFTPKLKVHLSSMGLLETQLHAVQATQISSKYLLANTEWKMKVRTPSGSTSIQAFATYILVEEGDGEFSIVFQIDHQELATTIAAQQNTP